MELTQEEKRILLNVSGKQVRTRTIGNEEYLYIPVIGINTFNSIYTYFDKNIHKILWECQDKLIDKNWVFEFDNDRILLELDEIKYGGRWYEDHNKDKLLTLAHAILYAIKKSK